MNGSVEGDWLDDEFDRPRMMPRHGEGSHATAGASHASSLVRAEMWTALPLSLIVSGPKALPSPLAAGTASGRDGAERATFAWTGMPNASALIAPDDASFGVLNIASPPQMPGLSGAIADANSGDTAYHIDGSTDVVIDDSDGYDTIYDGTSGGGVFDLRPGHVSMVGTKTITITPGTIIESVVGGQGLNVFWGNSADNYFLGTPPDPARFLDVLAFEGNLNSYTFTETPFGHTYTVTGPGIGLDTADWVLKFAFNDVIVTDDYGAGNGDTQFGSEGSKTGAIQFYGDVDSFFAHMRQTTAFTVRVVATDLVPSLAAYEFADFSLVPRATFETVPGAHVAIGVLDPAAMFQLNHVEALVVGGIQSLGSYAISISAVALQDPATWTLAGKGDQGWYVGDFNGDGRDDLLRYVDGVAGAQVLESTGGAFAVPVDFTGAGNNGRWWIGDFDGNGRDDVLRYNPGVSGAEVLLSTGTSFIIPASWSGAGFGDQGWVVGDFNGDGSDDLLRHTSDGNTEVLLSSNTGFDAPAVWSTYIPGAGGWRVGDFDGDGRDDLLRQTSSGPQVLLSTGNSFAPAELWLVADAGADGWYIGDFSGDGRSDLMRYVPGQTGAEVFLSTGRAFASGHPWTDAGHGADQWVIGQFDNGGPADLMRYLAGVGGEVLVL